VSHNENIPTVFGELEVPKLVWISSTTKEQRAVFDVKVKHGGYDEVVLAKECTRREER
jgi:hypothetical protein